MRRRYPHDEWQAERVLDQLAVAALELAVSLMLKNWTEIHRLANTLETQGELVL